MLNLSQQDIAQLAVISEQLSAIFGKPPSVTSPSAAGCVGNCEGICRGCYGCQNTNMSKAMAELSIDDVSRVLDNIKEMGPVYLNPETLSQLLLKKMG